WEITMHDKDSSLRAIEERFDPVASKAHLHLAGNMAVDFRPPDNRERQHSQNESDSRLPGNRKITPPLLLLLLLSRQRLAGSNPARCWCASMKGSATPPRSRARALTGRAPPTRASQPSRAPSPAPPGA